MFETCSLGTASALFNISDEEFVSRFVRRNQIYADKLHQFKMRDVLKLYESTNDSKERITKNAWSRRKDLDTIAATLYKIDGIVYSTTYVIGDKSIDTAAASEGLYGLNKK